MKKIKGICIKSIVLSVTSALLLTSCNIPGITEQEEADDDFFVYNSNSDSSVTVEKDDYKWLKEPSIKAANIITPDASQMNTKNKFDHAFLNGSIIFNNSKYGFIDYDGNILLEPSYDNYYFCSCGQMILFDKQDGKITRSCALNVDGTVDTNVLMHDFEYSEYFWDESKSKAYVKHSSKSFANEYTDDNAVVVMRTPVEQIDNSNYSIPVSSNSQYGLLKDGKIKTELVYEDYYVPAYRKIKSTAVAFKKNGKWGYVNEEGNEIIPFECSDVFSAFNGNLSEEKPHPYLFSYGYVPVCIDSKYCYYDMEGNKVASTVDFEQARPVINGRAWVKQSGKWGVIKLGEIKDYGEVTATTTEQTYRTYPKYTSNKNKTKTSTTTTTTKKVDKTTKKTTTKKLKKTTKKAINKTTSKPKDTKPASSNKHTIKSTSATKKITKQKTTA